MQIASMEGPGTACVQDLPHLIHLWSLCFHETEADASYFPSHRFVPEQTFVWRRKGTVCAVMYLIPVQGDGYRGGYLYAIGTHPAFQGQGIFSRLHQYVTEQAIAAGLDFLCLIPAESTLFSLYGRLGYESWYGREKLSMAGFCQPSVSVSIRDCTPEEYLSCIEAAFPIPSENPAHVFTEDGSVTAASSTLYYEAETDRQLVLKQHLYYDRFFKYCTIGNTSFVLAGYMEEHTLYLSQSSCKDFETLLQAAAALGKQDSCNELYLPPVALQEYAGFSAEACIPVSRLSTIQKENTITPYAMGLWLSQNHPKQPAPALGLMYT